MVPKNGSSDFPDANRNFPSEPLLDNQSSPLSADSGGGQFYRFSVGQLPSWAKPRVWRFLIEIYVVTFFNKFFNSYQRRQLFFRYRYFIFICLSHMASLCLALGSSYCTYVPFSIQCFIQWIHLILHLLIHLILLHLPGSLILNKTYPSSSSASLWSLWQLDSDLHWTSLDNSSDMTEHSWISWCPSLSFWVAV